MASQRRRVGIVGYGHLGRYLAKAIREDPAASQRLELAFVWNRTRSAIDDLPAELILDDLADFASRKADVIVEVAHPAISLRYGRAFLQHSHYMVGSPTALANADLEQSLRAGAAAGPYGLYVPAGALWGGVDIQRMSERGTLTSLTVTMKKAPHHFRLEAPLNAKLEEAAAKSAETVLFEGPVRELCPLAPNNVNTMAAAALAAASLGFDGVKARLIADPSLDRHVIEVDVGGPNGFRVLTERSNPAARGAVTGQATYGAFLSSLLAAGTQGSGVHLC